jgi:hypothetical protein
MNAWKNWAVPRDAIEDAKVKSRNGFKPVMGVAVPI